MKIKGINKYETRLSLSKIFISTCFLLFTFSSVIILFIVTVMLLIKPSIKHQVQYWVFKTDKNNKMSILGSTAQSSFKTQKLFSARFANLQLGKISQNIKLYTCQYVRLKYF